MAVTPRTGRRESGFTLAEVLVAFTILALSAGIVTLSFSNGLRVAGLAESYTSAVAVAESKLAELAVPENLRPGQIQGVAGGIRWAVTVLPFFLDPTAANASPSPDLYRISVQVAWEDDGGVRSLTLDTLRAPPRGGSQAPGDQGEGAEDEGNAGDEDEADGDGEE